MHQLPFHQPGHFYRGNLHTHSTRSDGALAPEVVVEAYRAHEYDFVALTDHFLKQYGYPLTDTRSLRSATFTTLIGAELHAPRTEAGLEWHLVAVGLPLDFDPPAPTETGPELAARAVSRGAFVGIAHPAWYSLTLADALTVEAAHAVEVYNEGSAQWSDRGNSWYLCDLMLRHGRRVNAYAADDAHFLSSRPAAFAAWVHVRATQLSPRRYWPHCGQGPTTPARVPRSTISPSREDRSLSRARPPSALLCQERVCKPARHTVNH